MLYGSQDQLAMSRVNGAKDLSQFFDKLEKNIQDGVSEIIEVALGDIENEARRNAPGAGDIIDTQNGGIRYESVSDRRRGSTPINQGISYRMITPYKGTVEVDESVGDIAVYVEMGTGQSAKVYLATVPPEWRAYAQLYYVNGQGTIIAQPYLLPAYNKYSIQVVKELSAFLKQVVK